MPTPPVPRTPASPPARRGGAQAHPRGIRFQLSSMLLLSTLNGIALAALLAVLFTSIQGGRSALMSDLREVSMTLSAAHDLLLLEAASGEVPNLEGFQGVIRGARDQLGAMALDNQEVTGAAIAEYAAAVTRWWEVGWGEAGAPGSSPGPQVLLQRMTAAHRRLLGELALAGEHLRPPWFDQAVAWARWGMAWVVLVALATLYMAFRLQKVLSLPLERLTAAAEAVGSGDLAAEIPAVVSDRRAPEIAALGRSVEAMRQRLVKSIGDLDERNAELATIFNSLSEGVLVVGGDGKIVEASPRVAILLEGRADGGKAPTPGQHLDAVLPGLPPGPLGDHLGDELELTLPLARAKRRHLTLSVQPLRSIKGRALREVVAVLRDVTHQQEVEDLKREFLSVVTHELKTPLTAIEGYAKLLLMGKGGGLSERQQGFAQTITDQTATLRAMIQNLLDATRLEGGNLPFDPMEADPAQLITEAGESFRASASTRGLAVEIEAGPAASARVRVDPFRVQQVLGNLMSNALKFTPEGGRITLSWGVDEGEVWMSVADTGRGIPEDALPHLFEKFYQVAKGDTRNAGGAGLGLYICRELVTAQGGTITAESAAGQGSRFTLRFPAARAPAEGSAALPQPQLQP